MNTPIGIDKLRCLLHVLQPANTLLLLNGNPRRVHRVFAAHTSPLHRLSVRDPEQNLTVYTFDDLGHTTSETVTLTGQGSQTRGYFYDIAGNLTTVVDRNGRAIVYGYDPLNRQTSEVWYANTNDAELDQNRVNTFTFVYDTANRLVSAADDQSSYTYGYDDLDRLAYELLGHVSVDLLHSYGTRLDGQRTRMDVVLDGLVNSHTFYTYDERLRVTSILQTPETGPATNNKLVKFTYGEDGRLDGIKRYADATGSVLAVSSSYTYDGRNRLTGLRHFQGVNTLAEYGYTYDALDRINVLTSVDGTADYEYDERGQLTSADYAFPGLSIADESFAYDDNGNRDEAGYDIGDHNRIASDGTFSYTYDAEGNRTSRVNLTTGDYTLYTWDHRNRLIEVADFDGSNAQTQQVVYKYDYLNRWIERVVNTSSGSEVAKYVYDGDQIVLALDGDDTVTERYLWGPAVDMLLAEEEVDSGTAIPQWALGDHQNSLRDYASFDGTTIDEHLLYSAFGERLAPTVVDHLFGFTGRPLDSATGLQNNVHRWYDSDLHQWLSEDPKGFGAGDANLRRYVDNDPVNSVDPKGTDRVEVQMEIDDEGALIPVVYYVDERNWGGLVLFQKSEQSPVRIGEIDNSGWVLLDNGSWSDMESIKRHSDEWTNFKSWSETRSKIRPDLQNAKNAPPSLVGAATALTNEYHNQGFRDKPMTPEEFGRMVKSSDDAAELVYQAAWFYGTAPLEIGANIALLKSARAIEAATHADDVVWSKEAWKSAKRYKTAKTIEKLFEAPVSKFLLKKYAGAEDYLNQRATYMHLLGGSAEAAAMNRQTTAVALVERAAGQYEVWITSNSLEYLGDMGKNYHAAGGAKSAKLAEIFVEGPSAKEVAKLNRIWDNIGAGKSTMYHAEKNLIIKAESEGARIIGIATQGRVVDPKSSERWVCYRCANWLMDNGIEILSPAAYTINGSK